jgi:Fe-S-cluster-containing hydrogenase component 2
MRPGEQAVIEARELDALFTALRTRGFRLLGPTVRDGAVVYDDLGSAADLPAGWTDEQDGGRYRLKRGEGGALFDFAVGPHSWKRFLHPPLLTLWRARRAERRFEILEEEAVPPPLAFIGVRACDLAAIAVQDRVFLGGAHVDPSYRARREGAFFVAVNCTRAGGTCFCASMRTGPRATSGFDLALTELGDGRGLLLEVGSDPGAAVAGALSTRPATDEERATATAAIARAAESMGRTLETAGLREALSQRYEDPHWDQVAKRCLTCGNCTMVCPTCFCATVEDLSDLAGGETEHRRRWDSCFTMEFSYIHGGSVRTSAGARYRQWITHKLATWHDQFGSSGCVGCGRCITWCPVGIDITEEARTIRQEGPRPEGRGGQDDGH